MTEEEKEIFQKFVRSSYDDVSVFLLDNKISFILTPEEIKEYNTTKESVEKLKYIPRVWNQHYVAQFYLKLFANFDWKVETFDQKYKKVMKSQSTESICSGSYFYSLETWKAGFVSQLLERFFNGYENRFAILYDKLVNDILYYRTLADKDIYDLCAFVIISLVRSKYFREELTNVQNDFMEEGFIMNNVDHIRFISDENYIEKLVRALFAKKIRIYISDWERNFITSDRCVLEVTPSRNTYLWWKHFMARIHYFVLSPKVLIEFYDPQESWEKIERRKVGKSEVIYYNSIRFICSRYLYSKSKDDFIEQDYTEARINYVDQLFELFPIIFWKDKATKDRVEKYAKEIWLQYESNYELFQDLLEQIEYTNKGNEKVIQ